MSAFTQYQRPQPSTGFSVLVRPRLAGASTGCLDAGVDGKWSEVQGEGPISANPVGASGKEHGILGVPPA